MISHPISIVVSCEKRGNKIIVKASDAWIPLEEKLEEWLRQYPWDLWFDEVEENKEYMVEVDAKFYKEKRTRWYPGSESFEITDITLIKNDDGSVFYNE